MPSVTKDSTIQFSDPGDEGTIDWSGVGNVVASDDIRAAMSSFVDAAVITISEVQLLNDSGLPFGNRKGGIALTTVDTINLFGDSSDTWGTTLTPAIVNSNTFGLRLQGMLDSVVTYDLVTRAYEFAIPTESQIQGIQVLVEGRYNVFFVTFKFIEIDHIQITVYYSGTTEFTTTGGYEVSGSTSVSKVVNFTTSGGCAVGGDVSSQVSLLPPDGFIYCRDSEENLFRLEGELKHASERTSNKSVAFLPGIVICRQRYSS